MNQIHHSKLPDLNLLKIFEAIYETRNLTRAADLLALTPSAVSHALTRLRYEFDDPLFMRQGKQMVPTKACKRIAPLLIEELMRLRSILQSWKVFDPTTTRNRFVIAMPELVEGYLFPLFAKHLQEKAPDASLISARLNRDDLQFDLAAGKIDLAIDVSLPIYHGLEVQKLGRDPIIVLARTEHPKEKLSIEDYLAARHIAVSSRVDGLSAEDTQLFKEGHQREVFYRCQSYDAAVLSLMNTDFLLTAPRTIAKALSRRFEFKTYDWPFKPFDYSLQLMWHKHANDDAATMWLRAQIEAQSLMSA